MLESETGLSTDMAVAAAKKFLRTMAQPFSGKDQEGISTWSTRDLEMHQAKTKDAEIRKRTLVEHGGKMEAVDEFDGLDDQDMLDAGL
jgi:DNA excision repair protein ERCC-2